MQRTTDTPESLDAAALRLYRHAVALAGEITRLREAALQLVQAAAAARADVDPAPVAARKQIEAVARGGCAIGEPVQRPTMGAVVSLARRKNVHLTAADIMDIERANEELQAVARYGAWSPGQRKKETVK
jgi:hypothetical protein